MGRSENVAIFEDTRALCQTSNELKQAIRESNNLQEIILEYKTLPAVAPRYTTPAKIVVSRKRSYEAAQGYALHDTCVLNFASATNPGGGVVWGSTAQEECLCRCSTLYANLMHHRMWDKFYEPHREENNPLYNDDCIYTPNVVVFKTDTAHTYCDMDDDEIYWQLDEWDYAKETGSNDGYGKYNDFYTAVQTGKNLKAVIKEYTDNGVGAEKLASEIRSHFKPIYKEMSNAERAGIKGYLLNAYALLGYDRSKKSKDIDKWLKD